jgi:hypothetical protein
VVKNLVSPFQGWADFHSDQIPRADPASGVPPAWAFCFGPFGAAEKRNTKRENGGPYLSERQSGTVRGDYSEDGNAWDVTRHDVSRDRGAISQDDPARNSRPVVRSAMMDVGVRSGRSLEPRPCDTSTPQMAS